MTFIVTFMCGVAELFLVILRYLKEFYRTWKLARQFKGRTPLTLLGNLPIKCVIGTTYGLNDIVSTVNELRLGQYWIGVVRHIFVSTPEDIQVSTPYDIIEAVLTNNKNNSKGILYDVADCPALVSLSGPVWKLHRRIIQPSFHMQVLLSLVEKFDRHGNNFIQELASKANGIPFDISEDMFHKFFLLILDGVMDSGDLSTSGLFIQELKQLFECFGKRMVFPWLYPTFIYRLSNLGKTEIKARKVIVQFIKEAIRKKRQQLKQISCKPDYDIQMPNQERRSFLSHLVAEQMKGAPITEDEMVEEVIQFFMAGVDTSDFALQSALYHMGNNRYVQDKALEELRGIFDGDSTVTAEKLEKMSYIEMIVKETLRLTPPIWLTSRVTGEDTPLPCGLIIPRGVQVLVVIKSLHTDPKIYPNPEVFDPERFSEERISNIGPYDYLPFMKGPRNCIGRQYAMMLLKSMIAQFIWNYEILPDPTYKPEYHWGVITHISKGTRIALRPRRRNM